MRRGTAGLVVAVVCAMQVASIAAAQRDRGAGSVIEVAPRPAPRAGNADRSGQAREGEARIVTNRALAGTEAVGVSGVLPEGTTARVVNLGNGRSTFVRVQPGGAESAGRLLDVTPPVARQLGMTGGTAQVRVVPLAVPQPDGTIRLGEGTPLAGRVAAPALSDRPQD
ncbi:hypothetical protein ACE7GA_05175 [Roseomonas sp. CCTCC AB2023176]|uniref:hypothetical protein n=1 Tax=Roseomonas sp. CCTCC AB2023176 TaxID=3342640 RepID=UPI0035E2C9F7